MTNLLELSTLPSTDAILQQESVKLLIEQFGRNVVLQAIHFTLDKIRAEVKIGCSIPSLEMINAQVGQQISEWFQPSLLPVINATGIILHTNLGRAPLSRETLAAMQTAAGAYSNLEYDLKSGKRGSRSVHAEALLQKLTGAESALVVNNNAAAVLLTLSALAHKKPVVIANSQLVEIGGGFRIPDVMRQSGAKLIPIGTTNRIHISDYEQALRDQPAIILTAHHSNFRIIGFTAEPELKQIALLAHQAGIPLVHDLGSGAMMDTSVFGLGHEPTVQEALSAGADVICFSGDKLMGGPQAGIILGRADLLAKIKRHPLARAVRADKLCLAGVSATLVHYLKGEALEKIPIWQMISMDVDFIHQRAERWQAALGMGDIIPGFSMVGGGSLPEESQPTWLLSIKVGKANQFLSKLRAMPQPLIARIVDDHVVLDPRTVFPEQDQTVVSLLNQALQS